MIDFKVFLCDLIFFGKEFVNIYSAIKVEKRLSAEGLPDRSGYHAEAFVRGYCGGVIADSGNSVEIR